MHDGISLDAWWNKHSCQQFRLREVICSPTACILAFSVRTGRQPARTWAFCLVSILRQAAGVGECLDLSRPSWARTPWPAQAGYSCSRDREVWWCGNWGHNWWLVESSDGMQQLLLWCERLLWVPSYYHSLPYSIFLGPPEDHDGCRALESHVGGNKCKVDDHGRNHDKACANGSFPVGPGDEVPPAKELLRVQDMRRMCG